MVLWDFARNLPDGRHLVGKQHANFRMPIVVVFAFAGRLRSHADRPIES